MGEVGSNKEKENCITTKFQNSAVCLGIVKSDRIKKDKFGRHMTRIREGHFVYKFYSETDEEHKK